MRLAASNIDSWCIRIFEFTIFRVFFGFSTFRVFVFSRFLCALRARTDFSNFRVFAFSRCTGVPHQTAVTQNTRAQYLSIYKVFPSVYLAVSLSIYLSVCLSVCLSIYLSVYIFLSPSISTRSIYLCV